MSVELWFCPGLMKTRQSTWLFLASQGQRRVQNSEEAKKMLSITQKQINVGFFPKLSKSGFFFDNRIKPEKYFCGVKKEKIML